MEEGPRQCPSEVWSCCCFFPLKIRYFLDYSKHSFKIWNVMILQSQACCCFFCFHIKAFRSSSGQERYFPSRSEERSFAASEECYFLNCWAFLWLHAECKTCDIFISNAHASDLKPVHTNDNSNYFKNHIQNFISAAERQKHWQPIRIWLQRAWGFKLTDDRTA